GVGDLVVVIVVIVVVIGRLGGLFGGLLDEVAFEIGAEIGAQLRVLEVAFSRRGFELGVGVEVDRLLARLLRGSSGLLGGWGDPRLRLRLGGGLRRRDHPRTGVAHGNWRLLVDGVAAACGICGCHWALSLRCAYSETGTTMPPPATCRDLGRPTGVRPDLSPEAISCAGTQTL